jgi:7,8-dihydro-6-hydroxymethylpterin dimethyltransferase
MKVVVVLNRDYIYYSYTKTLCNVGMRPIDGKVVYNDHGVFIVKTCSDHGQFKELLEESFAKSRL